MIIREENYTSPKDTKYTLTNQPVQLTPYANDYLVKSTAGDVLGMEISPDNRISDSSPFVHQYEMIPDTKDLRLSPNLSIVFEEMKILYEKVGETTNIKTKVFNGYRLMFPSMAAYTHSYGNAEMRVLVGYGSNMVNVSLRGSSKLKIEDGKLKIYFNLYFVFPYINPLTGVKEEYTVDIPRDVLDNKEELIVEIKLDDTVRYRFKAHFTKKVLVSVYGHLRGYYLKEK